MADKIEGVAPRPAEAGWVDFAYLRYRAGSVEGGRALFEELVRQLVAIEHPDVENVRAAPGDWGIDAFIGDLAGSLAVWQAKYFLSGVGRSQRAQVERSIESLHRSAAAGGFEVAEWILCIPVDLDAAGLKWWDEFVAREASLGLHCEVWTATQLLRRLLSPEGESVREYYFPSVTGQAVSPSHSRPAVLGVSELWRLPVTSPRVFGRQLELEVLRNAWADETQNIVTIVGMGGLGKSALLNAWLTRLAMERYAGAEGVFAWSFYRQDPNGQVDSADQFVDAALAWLGDPPGSHTAVWERGHRLATLLQRRRILLVLDGLEPLQEPPSSPRHGRIRDPAMRVLLNELAALNDGLCVVTSRVGLTDLNAFVGHTVKAIDLESLSKTAGVELLVECGVNGSAADLTALADSTLGHALTLTLLGNFLRLAHAGDPHAWDMSVLDEIDHREGGHLGRVMEAYDNWFGDGPEGQLLSLVALFDRPAPADQLAVLRSLPIVPGLNEKLSGLSDAGVWLAVATIRDTGLLLGETAGDPHTLDIHPIVRHHYREKLLALDPGAAATGHRRLYDHLVGIAAATPRTFAEMVPLLGAIYHASSAGMASQALHDVYWPRISQDSHYLRDVLGAVSANNEVLAYLTSPTINAANDLSDADLAGVLCDQSLDLRMLGQTAAAVQPLQRAVALAVRSEDWRLATNCCRHLSQLHVTLADLGAALDSANAAIDQCRRADDDFERMACFAALGDVSHQRGDLFAGAIAFGIAENIRRRLDLSRFGHRLTLYIALYRQCDFLLTLGVGPAARPLVDAADELCMLGSELNRGSRRAELASALIGLAQLRVANALGLDARPTIDKDEVIRLFRRAGQQPWLVEGLLTRARVNSTGGDTAAALEDIDEAFDLADSQGMVLQRLDCRYERLSAMITAGSTLGTDQETSQLRSAARAVGYGRLTALLTPAG